MGGFNLWSLLALAFLKSAVAISCLEALQGRYVLGWSSASNLCITMSADPSDLLVGGKGWLGFGIPEQSAGGMAGADIVVAEVDIGSYTADVRDMYTIGKITPIEDCNNDWDLEEFSADNDHVNVTVCRALNTGDEQDRPIEGATGESSDLFLVIVAMGTGPFAQHTSNNKEMLRVPLLGAKSDLDAFNEALNNLANEQDVVTVDLRHGSSQSRYVDFTSDSPPNCGNLDHNENGTVVPQCKTAYVNYYWNISDSGLDNLNIPGNDKWHIVGFEPLLETDTKANIHHFAFMVDYEILYIYAGGGIGLLLPNEAGFPISNTDGLIAIQTHYDNPLPLTTLRDNSGIRLYLKTVPREHDAGDPTLVTNGQTLPVGTHKKEFNCDGQCINHQYNVFGVMSHMHALGKVFEIEHRDSNGDLITNVWSLTEYYDWENQPILPENFTINPGDTFKTTCTYVATSPSFFGKGSEDEMCIGYAYYWPANLVSRCGVGECGGSREPLVATSISRKFPDPLLCPPSPALRASIHQAVNLLSVAVFLFIAIC